MIALLSMPLITPLITGAISLWLKDLTVIKWLNTVGSAVTSAMLLTIVLRVANSGPFHAGVFYVDQLSAVLLLVVALLSFTATVFSASYMEREVEDGHLPYKMLPRYYGLLNLFAFTMVSVIVVENLGLMWVAVEATTLASALLVAFYFNRSALEAAWKYVMVCTVGICLALLGTILLYYAQVSAGGDSEALSWLALKTLGTQMDPTMLRLAFIFIFIGYGTKAGLAPMHTWLPDAHSQAPSPVSGLLSGALLSCAVYAIVRNMVIVQAGIGSSLSGHLFVIFGILSIAIAVPFVLVQHDLKRLLAYSSVEHMGIIAVGLGIGTPLAVYGALLHIVNHAVTKSALFYLAGVITQEYRTKNIARIRGLVSTMPVIGTLFIVVILAITGTPPFSVFMSKFTIVWAAFADGQGLLGGAVLLLLAGIFAGMLYYGLGMAFGASRGSAQPRRVGAPALTALMLSVALMIIAGFYLPPWLNTLLSQAAAIIVGGQVNG